VLFISKKTAGYSANLPMVFVCKLFQSRLQVGQCRSYGVLSVLFMSRRLWYLHYSITRVQYLAETLLSKIRCGKRQ